MKFTFLLILTNLLQVMLYGQQATVKPERGGALFTSFNNRLVITAEEGRCSEITATADMGVLRKEDDCLYTFSSEVPGIVTIFLSRKVKGKEKVVGVQKIAVKTMPIPEAMVGRKKSGPFPLAQFKVQRGVGIVQQGFEGKPYFAIIAFHIKIFRNKALIFSDYGNGSYIRDDCKAFIQTLRVGDVVLIDNIKGTCSNCRILALNTLYYVMT